MSEQHLSDDVIRRAISISLLINYRTRVRYLHSYSRVRRNRSLFSGHDFLVDEIFAEGHPTPSELRGMGQVANKLADGEIRDWSSPIGGVGEIFSIFASAYFGLPLYVLYAPQGPGYTPEPWGSFTELPSANRQPLPPMLCPLRLAMAVIGGEVSQDDKKYGQVFEYAWFGRTFRGARAWPVHTILSLGAREWVRVRVNRGKR